MKDVDKCEAEARDRIGAVFAPIIAWDTVNEPMVRQWLEVFGYEQEYAQPGLRGDAPIPWTMMQVWTMPGYAGRHAPGSVECDAWDVLKIFASYGFTKAIGVSTVQNYDRQLSLGDRLKYTSQVHAVSSLKRTALGNGFFVTVRYAFTDQTGQSVGTLDFTMLVVHPAHHADAQTEKPQPRGDAAEIEAVGGFGGVRIPITATTIVATAIATRDFHPVHHDRDFARESGSPDIFMNILAISGYVERFVQTSLGLSVRILSLAVKLALPIYPGDVLCLTGRLQICDSADGYATISVVGSSVRGLHVDAAVKVKRP